MKVLKIDDKTLKIILSVEDMQKYNLAYSQLENPQCKSVILRLVQNAIVQEGLSENKAFVEAFPYIDGGILLYVNIIKKSVNTSRSNKIYKPCFDVPILCSFNSLSDAEKLSAFLKKDNSLIKSSLYKYLNKFLLLLYFPFSYDANMVVSEFCDIMLKGDIALSFAEEHANLLAKNNAVELLCL